MYGPYQGGTTWPYQMGKRLNLPSLVRVCRTKLVRVGRTNLVRVGRTRWEKGLKRRFFVCFAPNLQKTNKLSAVPNSKDISMKCT